MTKRKEPVRTRNQRACLLATDSPNQPEQKGLSARMVLPLQNALATLLFASRLSGPVVNSSVSAKVPSLRCERAGPSPNPQPAE